MVQITARLPDIVVDALDAAASQLKRSRAEIVRQAIERYLEDFDRSLGGHRTTPRSERSGAGLGSGQA